MSLSDGIDLASLSLDDILIKRRGLKRRLAERDGLQPIRIALLGGSTTSEVVNLLELWLLDSGFAPEFLESEFGRFYDDAVYDSAALEKFQPDVVYLHTSVMNVREFPSSGTTEAEAAACVGRESERFRRVWEALKSKLSCVLIQNNFEFPQGNVLGNLDATVASGRTRFVSELNREFALAAAADARLLVQDVCSISARVGLKRWFDAERWFSYKIATTPEASNALAVSLAGMIRAIYGRSRKVLVLDLDNTLWGGVIGDDGPENIVIGRETAVAEAYTAFQEYCLALRERGILLAVCSKNEESVARQGFEHPDSVLKLEHFAAFKANWEPKHENILAIARDLNLGVESFVFVDDNPAERVLVAAQIAGIAVPDVGEDVAHYPGILETGRYFEAVCLSAEDVQRASSYRANGTRAAGRAEFADYGEYLDSLEMVAEIDSFKPVYLERIAQLTNKTNQFNLTTRRYTPTEMDAAMRDQEAIGIYAKLSDRFGDHGLISVVMGRKRGDALYIDLWLMSCRVLKRDVEFAMLDALVQRAVAAGFGTIRGCYLPSRKNAMVATHYDSLGFTLLGERADGTKQYSLALADYAPKNRHIRVLESN